MKLSILCLALMLCAKMEGAVADDLARAFLINALANNAVAPLTNLVPVTKVNTVLIATTNGTVNASVGGMVAFDNGSYTNLNALAQLTNLAEVIIGANTLAVDGARVHGEWGGKLMNAAASTNQITITLGAVTVLDTGLIPWSNSVFMARALVVRTGPSSQHVEAFLRLGSPGNVGFSETNINVETSLNNASSRRLSLNGASRRLGGITNNGFRVYYESIRPE